MRGSRQSLPTLIEECRWNQMKIIVDLQCSQTKLLCEITATTFDAGQAYSNSRVKIELTQPDLLIVNIQGSHEAHCAYFTDSNELDQAIMTERFLRN